MMLGTAFLLVLALAGPLTAYPRPGGLDRVSVATGGGQGNGWNIDVSISPDNRFVVFGSSSSNVVPNDTNGVGDVFVHDRVTRVTERISVASDGTQANAASANGISNFAASISTGGRYVAFVSEASNLVPGDTNGAQDVFVHDRLTRKTDRVSVVTGGGQGDKGSSSPSLSADGRYVAFSSAATNLVPGDTNSATDCFVHDRVTGVTERVSLSYTGAQGVGVNPNSIPPFLSADGRYVAFSSNATNLIPDDGNSYSDAFVRDRVTGVVERVSVAADGGPPNEVSHVDGISEDGRFVVFDSQATNLVPADTNGPGGSFAGTDVFVYDRQLDLTERVSVRSDGSEASSGLSNVSSISPDGRYITFQSEVADLVPGDTNNQIDGFLYDRVTGQLERVSVGDNGQQGWGQARDATTGTGGRYVAFSSSSDNLIPGDSNNARDVFVRDRGPEVGIGALMGSPISTPGGPKMKASGWASFSGTVLTEADDPVGDGGSSATEAGGDLIGASLVHRPEAEDLLVHLSVEGLPDANPACRKGLECQATGLGRPGVVYGMRFALDGVRYEVRGTRFSPSSTPPSDGEFGVYRCLETCVRIAAVGGGIGTAGKDARIAVPLTTLQAATGTVTQVQAFTALGDASAGAVTPLDELSLPSTVLTAPSVQIALANPNVPYEQVPFSQTASIDKGTFQGSVLLPAGTHRLWARACGAGGCSGTSVVVSG